MPTLLLRFPGKRYHATPWGHHVNEGLIEWPPSPWRLLRALLATGYTRLQWPPDGPPPAAIALIEKLAGTLPIFKLPQAVGAHTRHYMPMGRFKNGREETTLVFDTWAQIDDGELKIHWDVNLSEAENSLLAELAGNLGYLGRSESWVVARLADDADIDETWCRPCKKGEPMRPGWQQVSLLATVGSGDYAQWRQDALSTATADLAKPSVLATPSKVSTQEDKELRRQAEKQNKIIQSNFDKAISQFDTQHPCNLLSCIQVTTEFLHAHGWAQPPGSLKVFYWRPDSALEAKPLSLPRRRHDRSIPAMLLSLTAPRGNDHALPMVYRSLPQAELLHRAVVQAATKGNTAPCPVLTGCDEQRRPLKGAHEHAHIVPLDLDDDGHIDHVLIWAKMGLDSRAQAAIRSVRRTFTKNGSGDLKLSVAASGSLDELVGITRTKSGASVLGLSTTWASVTPFIAPRYVKKNGHNQLFEQVRTELLQHGITEPVTVTYAKASDEVRKLRHFVRSRGKGPQACVDMGYAIELRFERPVQGPIAVGYGSHFGLGLFKPIAKE